MSEDEIRDRASGFMGREITDEEWSEAYPEARRKLECIIEREGDAGGKRREAAYIGLLVQEIIVQNAFCRYCMAKGA